MHKYVEICDVTLPFLRFHSGMKLEKKFWSAFSLLVMNLFLLNKRKQSIQRILHFPKLVSYYTAISCCTVMRVNACMCALPLAHTHSCTYSSSPTVTHTHWNSSPTSVHTCVRPKTPALTPVHTRVNSLASVHSLMLYLMPVKSAWRECESVRSWMSVPAYEWKFQ